jgi:hypothetical protein
MLNDDLRASYTEWCKQHKRRVETQISFGKLLGKLGEFRQQRILTQEGSRLWGKDIPHLAKCRQDAEKYIGQKGPWTYEENSQ